MQEESRGSKNSSINTLQEIALLNLSGSINTRNTETFFVSFLFYFCFMLYALIQHIFTYLSLSSYIALLIKNNSGYYTAYSHKTFSHYKSIFQFVYFFFLFLFKWHVHSLKGGMENEEPGCICFITVIFIMEEKLNRLPLVFRKTSEKFYCLTEDAI